MTQAPKNTDGDQPDTHVEGNRQLMAAVRRKKTRFHLTSSEFNKLLEFKGFQGIEGNHVAYSMHAYIVLGKAPAVISRELFVKFEVTMTPQHISNNVARWAVAWNEYREGIARLRS